MAKSRYTLTPTRLRKKRRKILLVKFLLGIFVIFISLFFVRLFSNASFMTISQVEIVGSTASEETSHLEQIVKGTTEGYYGHLISKSNVFFYPRGKIIENLSKTFKQVKGVEVDLNNWSKLTITIEERKPFEMWCTSEESGASIIFKDDCYFLDNQGYAFSKAPEISGDAYFKNYGNIQHASTSPIGQQFLTPELFKAISSFRESLSKRNINPDKLIAKIDGDFEFYLPDGGRILFNTSQNFNVVLENIESLLQDPDIRGSQGTLSTSLDYIDLRFGNKIFYKKR